MCNECGLKKNVCVGLKRKEKIYYSACFAVAAFWVLGMAILSTYVFVFDTGHLFLWIGLHAWLVLIAFTSKITSYLLSRFTSFSVDKEFDALLDSARLEYGDGLVDNFRSAIGNRYVFMFRIAAGMEYSAISRTLPYMHAVVDKKKGNLYFTKAVIIREGARVV